MPSIYEDTLKLYKQIDAHIASHYKSAKQKPAPCTKGCASCCSQFFEISPVEFLVIQNHLKDIDPTLLDIFKENSTVLMSLFKEYHRDFYEEFFHKDNQFVAQSYYQHPERFKIHLPCVFLSKEGYCQIYPVRPFVCRTTGVGFKRRFVWGPICNEIRFGYFVHYWQADLRPFVPQIETITSVKLDHVSTRQYPMFYLMSQVII